MAGEILIVDTATEQFVEWRINSEDVEMKSWSEWFVLPFAKGVSAMIGVRLQENILVRTRKTSNEDVPHVTVRLLFCPPTGGHFPLPFESVKSSLDSYEVAIPIADALGGVDAADFYTFRLVNEVDILPEPRVYKNQRLAMLQMLEDEVLTDFELICEGKSIKVSKFMLASRSDVFRKMFEVDMDEKKSGQAVIEDISYQGLYALIKFIYSSELDARDATPDVVFAADKYNVQDLKTVYEDVALKMLTMDTVDEMIMVAYKYKMDRLLEKCFQLGKATDESRCIFKKLLARVT